LRRIQIVASASTSLPQARARFGTPVLNAQCVSAGLAAGAVAVLVNPLILLGLVIAAPVGLWLLSSVNRAMFALIVVIGLLPRFALPVRLGFTPTFLDLALIGLLIAWLLRQMSTCPDLPLRRAPVAIPILLLIAAALATFLVGLPNGALTPSAHCPRCARSATRPGRRYCASSAMTRR
jgi:hypothetical protein